MTDDQTAALVAAAKKVVEEWENCDRGDRNGLLGSDGLDNALSALADAVELGVGELPNV